VQFVEDRGDITIQLFLTEHYGLFVKKKVVGKGSLEMWGYLQKAYKILFASALSTPRETLGCRGVSSISQVWVLQQLIPLP